ncbi:MAG TPA: hypothetical protein PLR99_01420 [Polyangiaceae bacterium]|nr:hypothetical protein [Polyangiaceae bacterium]
MFVRATSRLRVLGVATTAFAAPLAALSAFSACSGDPKPSGPPPLVLTDEDVAKRDVKPIDPPDTALPPPPDSGGPTGTIYVQTGVSLQVYDPYSKALKNIGKYACLPDSDFVFDIAVDRDNNVYAVTAEDRFLKVDPLSGACTVIRQGAGLDYPLLIAFVPRGSLDAANDALVGFDGELYLRIDLRTGGVTSVGELNPPDAGNRYAAIGDLIFAGKNGMFLTATPEFDAGAADAGDTFIRFDPKTGRRLAIVGTTGGYRNLYGLGYWGGSIFAFTTPGEILKVSPTNAATTLVKRIDGGPPKEGGAPEAVFFGAGSTTVAPETPAL